MSFFGDLLGAPPVEQRVTGRELLDMIEQFDLGNRSKTGVTVTPQKALANPAVMQAVLVQAATASTLPLILYERFGENRQRAAGHRLYPTLHDQPNPQMNVGVFTRVRYLSKLLRGAAYAEIEFDGAMRPLWLWHLPSAQTTPRKLYKRLGGGLTEDPANANPEDRRRGGTVLFEVTGTAHGTVYLEPERVFHTIDHLSPDGITPLSRITAALEPIALGLAAQDTAASIFGNDATPGLVIKRPVEAPSLPPSAVRSRLAAWEATHGGRSRKAGRVAYLQEGEEIQQVTLSPHDAQLLEIIQLGILQVAQIFNLPPYFLGYAGGSSEIYSNVEAEWTKLATQTLMPHLVDDQQEVRRKLLRPDERDRYFAEYELKALLKGDAKTRAEVYKTLKELGAMTTEQIARAENLPPVPAEQGGQTLWQPLTHAPAESVIELQRARAAAAGRAATAPAPASTPPADPPKEPEP